MIKLHRLRFPMRLKILLALLVVVTSVVGLITFTMANLFHSDKGAYISDLTTSVAAHTAEETNSLLKGYSERLQVFGRIMRDESLDAEQKTSLLHGMFDDFPAVIAVTLYRSGREQSTIFDAKLLRQVGLSSADLQRFRREHTLPLDRVLAQQAYVTNSTVDAALPTLTLAVALPEAQGDIVAAVIQLKELIAVTTRSGVFAVTITDNDGFILAHRERERLTARRAVDWLPDSVRRELAPLVAGRTSATALKYSAGGEEYIAAFARTSFSGLIIIAEIPSSTAYLTSRDLLGNLTGLAFGMLIGSALLGLIWSRSLTRTLEKLSDATRAVGKGEFDIQVDAHTRDEMGLLAGSFKQMAAELKTREQALNDAQAALVQSEKMSAFGQLSAGIAHEVKNPLAGILGYAQLSLRKIDPENPVYKNLQLIEKETKRTKTIIENLMRFARQEQVVKQPTDINQVAEDAVAIVDHQLTINQVQIVKELSVDLPRIMGNANQIQQVLMNFMINAQQAMDGQPGTVTISTRRRDEAHIEVRVADTGPGIPREIQAKIFEPFFTTKVAGKGTGLGLSVSFGIIKDHFGEICVESEPGRGATFIITFPLNEGDAATAA